MKTTCLSRAAVSLLATALLPSLVTAQNVGVGTSTPKSKLSVNGSTASGGIAVGDTTYTSTTGTVAPLNGAIIQGFTGIGTTAPSTRLNLRGDGSQPWDAAILVDTSASPPAGTSAAVLNLRVLDNTALPAGSAFGRMVVQSLPGGASGNETGWDAVHQGFSGGTNPLTAMRFFTAGGTGGVERMRIDSTGNVGIGVTVPTEKLHVNTSIDNEGIALSQTALTNTIMLNSNAGGAYLGFINNSTSTDAALTAFIQQREPSAGTQANDLIYNVAGGGNHVFVGGPVGINTAAPAAGFWLDVSGNIQCNNIQMTAYAGGGNREIGVNNVGSVIIFASDARLKKNVIPVAQGLGTVMKLRPVSYQWKDVEERGEQRELGFIAQEVKPLVPEVVGSFKKDGEEYNTMSYARLVPVLTKAIQEQQTQIEALNRQNTSTAREVTLLKEENARLKAAGEKLTDMAAEMDALKKAVAAMQPAKRSTAVVKR
jgi:hypothetical protein